MAFKVTRVDTWAVSIEDQPGGLHRVVQVFEREGEVGIARELPRHHLCGVPYEPRASWRDARYPLGAGGHQQIQRQHQIRISDAHPRGGQV